MLVDRAKDMIIRGGENIYPREIEAVVHQLPQIAEAAVVGRPNPVYGEEPVLFVSLHPGKQLHVDLIREHLRESLSKYKLPVEITILDDLPKNAVGKIDKRSLRQRLADNPLNPTTTIHHPPNTHIGELIMSFTKPEFPDVDPDTFLQKPLMERMRILALNWAENGFGSPRMVHAIYIAKLVLFYALGGDSGRHADVGAARVLACLAVVEPADRVRESHPVDGAARAHRTWPDRGVRWPARSSR